MKKRLVIARSETTKQSQRLLSFAHNDKAHKILKSSFGFSLVELLVSVSIFMIITSITLTNYPRFSNKLSLDLLAQDIALSIRQAQIFGASVLGAREADGGQQRRIFGAYGVHFDPPVANQPIYPYFLFADIANPSEAREFNAPRPLLPDLSCNQPTMSNECVQKFLITGRNKVKFLCANFSNVPAEERISHCEQSNQLSALDIVFVRPNLDAKFTAQDRLGNPVNNISNVGIVLESPGGQYYKTIVVWKTGQIAVE